MSNETTDNFLDYIAAASCYPYTPTIGPAYGYRPSLGAAIFFVIAFTVLLAYHTFQSVRRRAAISILLALGALVELIGWASRLYASRCPYNNAAFISQEVTLIIAPVFFSAALYVLLGQLIIRRKHQHHDARALSPLLTPRMYAIVFCTCDVVSLVIQAVGGAMASEADTVAQQDTGTHIMVAGIAFQLATMTLFGGLAADFVRRVVKLGEAGGLPRRRTALLAAATVCFAMIYIRGVYRTIELAEGWSGYLITHEGYFIGLDAVLMVIAVAVFVVVDPAIVMRANEGEMGSKDALLDDFQGYWQADNALSDNQRKLFVLDERVQRLREHLSAETQQKL